MVLIQNTPHLWLLAGAVLIVLEFLAVPGVGFLFIGFGALTAGILVELGLVHQSMLTWVIFLATTILWAVLLWKPLSNFRVHKTDKEFSDMVGHKAILLTDLIPGQKGQARWSGTIMNAQLDESALSTSAGAEVTITRVEKNILFVK